MIFLCHHLLNLAGFSSLLPASGTGTSALGWIFFPVSQALAPCYSVWVANIARECFNTNKMSHPLNVRMWFASWNSETGARGLGSMPLTFEVTLRGEWFNCFLLCGCDTGGHCKHIPEVYKFFADFWQVIPWILLCLLDFSLSIHLYEALWEKC